MGGYPVEEEKPGGLPLRFAVVEESLVVVGVAGESNRSLLRSRLIAVEGVPLAGLLARQKRLRGIANSYHGLPVLVEQSLWYRPSMQDLIPEWTTPGRVNVDFVDPGGSAVLITLEQPGPRPNWIRPRSRVALPRRWSWRCAATTAATLSS
jgi:hypothetical protein